MRDDDIDYKGKFWVGQRVQVFPERIRVQEGTTRILGIGNTGVADTNAVGYISNISVLFLKSSYNRIHIYRVWMDKPMTNTGSRYYGACGDEIEPIEGAEVDGH